MIRRLRRWIAGTLERWNAPIGLVDWIDPGPAPLDVLAIAAMLAMGGILVRNAAKTVKLLDGVSDETRRALSFLFDAGPERPPGPPAGR